MPRTCTICDHPQKEEIDSLIINGNTFRHIASQYNFSYRAVKRHKDNHLNKKLAKAKEAREIVNADNLLDQVKSLQEKALELLDKAEAENDFKTALIGVREARGCCELLGKLLGELNDSPQINILLSSEWVELRTLIIQSLDQYPKARISITKALEKFTNERIIN